ncbi:hypothetical protein PTTW11_04824 [Pyrenophora teres f. teres]|uniref:Uncharacterized protein n=1 Tax=Pyrenophora teres f. teres TaxID=97479 RepID=A0A6S6W2C6_9PLEO|nr:hypothetical protein PTTW11_04824 [Pyrenophora teres f. teres]
MTMLRANRRRVDLRGDATQQSPLPSPSHIASNFLERRRVQRPEAKKAKEARVSKLELSIRLPLSRCLPTHSENTSQVQRVAQGKAYNLKTQRLPN